MQAHRKNKRDDRFDVKSVLEAEFKRVGFGWDVKGIIDSGSASTRLPTIRS